MPLFIRVVLGAALLLALSLPATSSAAPAGFVGLSADDLFGNPGPYRDKALAQQRAAGVQLLRVAFDWSAMEVAPGRFDFSFYDRYVLDAAKQKISFLPVLIKAPDFYSVKPGTRFAFQPRRNADMARWAKALVDRYGRNGTLWKENPGVTPRQITAWQIWNEPHLKQYWYRRPNARQYGKMLKSVGAAIKSRDRKAEIVTAGISDSFQGGAVRMVPYLKALYRSTAGSAFKTVAINSYAVTPRYVARLLNRARKTMNRSGGRSDKIWITEIGWCDKGFKHRFCVGTKRQAKYTTDGLKLIKKERRAWKLRGFVWYAWRDGRPYTGKDFWGNHSGLLTIGGKKKPAFNAFVRGVKRF